jgi:hypothetical protein
VSTQYARLREVDHDESLHRSGLQCTAASLAWMGAKCNCLTLPDQCTILTMHCQGRATLVVQLQPNLLALLVAHLQARPVAVGFRVLPSHKPRVQDCRAQYP